MLVHRWMRGHLGDCCRWWSYVVYTWFVAEYPTGSSHHRSAKRLNLYILFLFIIIKPLCVCIATHRSWQNAKVKKRTDENARNPALAVAPKQWIGRSVDVGFCRPLYRVWALRCGIHSNFFRSFWALRESRLSRVFGKYIKIPNRWLQSTARSVYLHLYNRDGRMFDHIDFSAIKLW